MLSCNQQFSTVLYVQSTLQGWVVQRTVDANPGLKVNGRIDFFLFLFYHHLMLFVVSDHSDSKLKDKQCEQKTSPKSYKTEIKILVNPGLA